MKDGQNGREHKDLHGYPAYVLSLGVIFPRPVCDDTVYGRCRHHALGDLYEGHEGAGGGPHERRAEVEDDAGHDRLDEALHEDGKPEEAVEELEV